MRVSKYLKLKSEKMQRLELQTLEQNVFNFALAFLETQSTVFLSGGEMGVADTSLSKYSKIVYALELMTGTWKQQEA